MTDAIDPPKTPRLLFLDGLRGLSALFVVFHHAIWGALGGRSVQHFIFRYPYRIAARGQLGVDMFIVLSGFCLMLPAVPNHGYLKGGLSGFFYRRTRRIFPPYLAALAIFSFLTFLIPWLHTSTGTLQDYVYPRDWSLFIGTHLVMLHNLGPWIGIQVDPPMWSVATEWQIYFVFALLLLPLFRRFGVWLPLFAALLIGYTAHMVDVRLVHAVGAAPDQAWDPWLLGLFGMGMAAAVIVSGAGGVAAILRERVPWRLLCGISVLALIAVICRPITRLASMPRTDLIAGIASASLIIYCTNIDLRESSVRRFLEQRWVIAVGAWSYSLYLVHWPILSLFRISLKKTLHVGLLSDLVAEVTVGVLFALAISYLFHLVFEKPFLSTKHNGHRSTRAATPFASSPSPEFAQQSSAPSASAASSPSGSR